MKKRVTVSLLKWKLQYWCQNSKKRAKNIPKNSVYYGWMCEGIANFPYQILLVIFHSQYRNDEWCNSWECSIHSFRGPCPISVEGQYVPPTLLRALPPGFSNLLTALKGQTFSVPSCWPLHKILAKKSSIDIVLHRVYHIYDNELREQFINFVEKRIMLIFSQNFDCHIQIWKVRL